MRTREHATVRNAKIGPHEHYGTITLEMGFEFDCAFQGLGGLCLDANVAPKVEADLCALFGVSTLSAIVGRQCFVLRCWPYLHEPIEGIEVDGRRWTITDLRRRYYPNTAKDRLAERVERIQADIARNGAEVQRGIERLRTVRDGYVDWSSDSSSDTGGDHG